MSSVWKRLQRVNKRAAKFQYTASYHRIDLETTAKWKPSKLSVVWTRRSRRVATEPLDWEPSLKDPLKGSVIYPVPENHSVAVTLFKDSRTNELEDKDWTFVLEDVTSAGKRRRIAQANINMRLYASLQPSQRALTVPLVPSARVKSATVVLTLHCVLLTEGRATDEDMQSLASLLSVNNNSDIGVLEDLDGDFTLSDDSSRQVLDLCQQMEQLTRSLSETPDSVRSLPTDRTPTAPETPATPLEDDMKTPQNQPDDYNDFIEPPVQEKVEPPPPPKTIQIENKPKIDLTPEITTKLPVFRTKSVTKLNLKPLEFKTNFNLNLEKERELKTPEKETIDMTKQEKMDRVKTPVQDLLEWCQSVTEDYKQVNITDLTNSFRSGIAFCAIIHHFRPDLIDFSGLDPKDREGTLRLAFSTSEGLGVPPLLRLADMNKHNIDRLQMMTYLFQLRAHFTGSELEVEQLGNDDSESTYLVGRHDTDENLPPTLFSREIVTRRSRNIIPPYSKPQVIQDSDHSTPDSAKDSHDSNDVFKTLSPIKDTRQSTDRNTNWFTDPLHVTNEISPKPEMLMTRKELTDPFGSDDEEEPKQSTDCTTDVPRKETEESIEREITPLSPSLISPIELPKPTPQLLSRHDELKEKARQLLEATKREAREMARNKRQGSNEMEDESTVINGDLSPKQILTEEERQAMLRERARKLIADARAGIVSPASPGRPRGTVEVITPHSVLDEVANNGGDLESILRRTDSINSSPMKKSHSLSPVRSDSRNSDGADSIKSALSLCSGAPLSQLSRLSPDCDKRQYGWGGEGGCAGAGWAAREQAALARQQAAVDARAEALEAQLRRAMAQGDHQEEDKLLVEWFQLVNKKNALLRRQMQLNILERSDDLSVRCGLLAAALRRALAQDEWRKTPDQKQREALLLQELVEAVNERDRLVHEMDEQEKAIADDDEIERNLSQVDLQRKNNCVIS